MTSDASAVRLADEAAIERLLVQYATAIDTRDWDLLRRCFAPNVEADYGEMGRWAGRDELAEYMERAHAGFEATSHLLTNFVIDVDGERATAKSSVHVVLVLERDRSWIDVVGRYDDRLEAGPDGWRIVTRTFRPTRLLSSDDLRPSE